MRTFHRIIGLIAFAGIMTVSCTKTDTNIYDGLVCYVSHGLQGLISMNRTKYDVNWSSFYSFSLSQTQADQTIIAYSGLIKGNSMSLDVYNCDGIARTYSLYKAVLFTD